MPQIAQQAEPPPLNTSFAEVDFDRQWPCFLNFHWLLRTDSNHWTQVVRADLVHVLQEFFISIDAQLKKKMKTEKERTS